MSKMSEESVDNCVTVVTFYLKYERQSLTNKLHQLMAGQVECNMLLKVDPDQ